MLQVECFGLRLEDDLEAVEQEEEIEYICLWEVSRRDGSIIGVLWECRL